MIPKHVANIMIPNDRGEWVDLFGWVTCGSKEEIAPYVAHIPRGNHHISFTNDDDAIDFILAQAKRLTAYGIVLRI